MAFRWNEVLDVAHALAPDAHPNSPQPVPALFSTLKDEARYRVTMSRAYYAALGVCREYIKANDPTYHLSGTGVEHTEIRHFFTRKRSSSMRKVGRSLFKLKEARHKADYQITLPLNWKSEAETSLRRADEICKILK